MFAKTDISPRQKLRILNALCQFDDEMYNEDSKQRRVFEVWCMNRQKTPFTLYSLGRHDYWKISVDPATLEVKLDCITD